MPLTKIQREEFEEYMETILDLYSEDEYESDVENIVYHYCKRKYDIEREESVNRLKPFMKLFKVKNKTNFIFKY